MNEHEITYIFNTFKNVFVSNVVRRNLVSTMYILFYFILLFNVYLIEDNVFLYVNIFIG